MNEFIVEEAGHAKGAKIKIIGCGGGGSNMIDHMIKMGLSSYNNLDLIAANTDGQHLAANLAKTKIQLGEKITRGLGAGGNPQVGSESAKENFEEIKAALENSDIVFIASGLGGGTGTGASPIIARAAKEIGALTVSVVTMPFDYEGKKKKELAEAGLIELKKESDSILVIQNDRVLNLIDKNVGFDETYVLVDDILSRAVKGMVSILLENSRVNVDFADVKAIMSHRGLALMGMGEASGASAAVEALNNALESPLLDSLDIKNAKGVIVHFKNSPKFPFLQIVNAAKSLQEILNENVTFKYGINSDDNIAEDKIEVTIIVTGFEYQEQTTQPTISKEEKEAKKMPYVSLGRTGTHNDEETITYLDSPAFLRRQMD